VGQNHDISITHPTTSAATNNGTPETFLHTALLACAAAVVWLADVAAVPETTAKVVVVGRVLPPADPVAALRVALAVALAAAAEPLALVELP
jgi:hypothetical protein